MMTLGKAKDRRELKTLIMTASKCEVSRCGLCRFYVHEGRRGGMCSQLDVPVSSRWKACRLAVSPFSTALQVVGEPVSEVIAGIDDWAVVSMTPSSDVSALDVSALDVSALNGADKPRVGDRAIANPKVALTTKAQHLPKVAKDTA